MGAKNIKAIQAEPGAELNIEDDGTAHIYASKHEGLERAKCLGVDEKGRVKVSRRAWPRDPEVEEAEAAGPVEESTTPLA